MATMDVALHSPAAVQSYRGVQPDDFMPVLDMVLARKRRDFMLEVTRDLMVDGVDYGVIPGTPKPTLYKAGAERLCSLFGLSPTFEPMVTIEDWTGKDHGGEPLFYYQYRCRMVKNGVLLGEGIGSANTWESKYRYRWMPEDQVPMGLDKKTLQKRGGRITEPDFAINKAETTGKYGKPAEYWQAFKDAIERGEAKQVEKKTQAGKAMTAWEIDAVVFRVPNAESPDVVNTAQKMAQKRALVAACLLATNASEFYTQDLEDLGPSIDVAFTAHTAADTPKESRDEVTARRIAEEQARANGSVQPGAPAAAAPPANEPEELTALVAGCQNRKGIEAALTVLGDKAAANFGEAKGEGIFKATLEKSGAGGLNELYKSVAKSRAFVRAWYWAIEHALDEMKPKAAAEPVAAAAKPAQRNPDVTDADLPGELFGNNEVSQ